MRISHHLKQKLWHFYRDRSGAFAVSLAILSALLLSLAALGIEGSRYIRERARMSDAMEQAALALVAEDNGKNSYRNDMLVYAWLDAYMPGSGSSSRVPELSVSKGIDPRNDQLSYIEYRVNASFRDKSWLSSSFFPSFEPQVEIGNNAAARKYRTTMNVMFAVDFSSSMQGGFSGGGGAKIDALKKVVMSISQELLADNEGNQIGFSPFAYGTRSDDGTYCNPQFASNRKVPTDVLNVPGYYQDIVSFHSYVDIQKTFDRFPAKIDDFHIPYDHILSDGMCLKGAENTKPILLTSSLSELSTLNAMQPNGATLVSSGMLQGTRLLMKGPAPRKILVIVSDGMDDPTIFDGMDLEISSKLIALGLCNKIRDVLTTRDAFGQQTVGKIAFIGVDYTPTLDWKSCVGANNYFEVSNAQDFTEAMRRAVFEEVGHSTVKDE